MPVKVIQRLIRIIALQKRSIGETKLDSLTEGFENQSRQLGESHFTYYNSDVVSMLKKQFHLVYRSQLSTNQDY